MLDKMLVRRRDGHPPASRGGGDRAAAHALNVTRRGAAASAARSAWPSEDMLDLGVGALLHDVGKLDLPERVRHARRPHHAPAEAAAYREHVARGVRARPPHGADPAARWRCIAQHHEHADGSGFPQRLDGRPHERWPRASSRIVNRYDNLCNPAARGARADAARGAWRCCSRRARASFDAAVLNAFIRMMGVYPAGSLVQLTDDRYAHGGGRQLQPPAEAARAGARPAGAARRGAAARPRAGRRPRHPAQPAPRPSCRRRRCAYLDPRPRVSYFFEPLARRGRRRSWPRDRPRRGVTGSAPPTPGAALLDAPARWRPGWSTLAALRVVAANAAAARAARPRRATAWSAAAPSAGRPRPRTWPTGTRPRPATPAGCSSDTRGRRRRRPRTCRARRRASVRLLAAADDRQPRRLRW
ncbi:MAG: hypothetical protein MZW92_55495 [Comamonadaceae bacterium]|nr:hypothetical protein [Comamonadaceae bacterium]